jgi:hypothetical protein
VDESSDDDAEEVTGPTGQTGQTGPVAGSPIGTPIILSLPISDSLENRLTKQQSTLESQLTAYRPDVALPSASVSSRSIGGATYEGQSKPITMDRCGVCASRAGPCQGCIDQFNQKIATTYDAYKESRIRDERDGRAQQKAGFQNIQIADRPIDRNVLSSVEYNAYIQIGAGDSADIAGAPVGIGPDGIDGPEPEEPKTLIRTPSAAPVAKKTVSFSRAKPEKPVSKEEISAVKSEGRECLWHLSPFEGPPVGLPLTFCESTQSFECIGYFCSLGCAYAYRLEHRSADAAPIRLLHLAHSMSDANDKRKLVPAPPRQALKRFGGTKDLNTFLKGNHAWYSVTHTPFVFVPEHVERIDDPSMYRSMSGAAPVSLKSESAIAAAAAVPSTELVRKRDKPHPNSMNQWHSSVQRSRVAKK